MKPTTETTMTQTSTTDTSHICPKYEQAIQLLGKRWTGLLLYTLLEGPKRFCELTSTVEGLSDRVLSDRLRELELEGVVERVVYPQIPVRVEYKLTEKGRGLEPVVLAIRRWADKWVPSPDSSLTPSAQ
jgi:DNA-binding HxlR family transcriptional regulator